MLHIFFWHLVVIASEPGSHREKLLIPLRIKRRTIIWEHCSFLAWKDLFKWQLTALRVLPWIRSVTFFLSLYKGQQEKFYFRRCSSLTSESSTILNPEPCRAKTGQVPITSQRLPWASRNNSNHYRTSLFTIQSSTVAPEFYSLDPISPIQLNISWERQ